MQTCLLKCISKISSQRMIRSSFSSTDQAHCKQWIKRRKSSGLIPLLLLKECLNLKVLMILANYKLKCNRNHLVIAIPIKSQSMLQTKSPLKACLVREKTILTNNKVIWVPNKWSNNLSNSVLLKPILLSPNSCRTNSLVLQVITTSLSPQAESICKGLMEVTI